MKNEWILRPIYFYTKTKASLNLIYNHMRNPERVLRNANDLYVPAHHFATVKRFPLFLFPQIWNEEDVRKLNPSLKSYCKMVKASLLATLAD
jgi:hypothetical protein